MSEPTSLADYGWSPRWERLFREHAGPDRIPARVISQQGGMHRLVTEVGERLGRTSGRLRHRARGQEELPVVGDWVVAELPPDTDLALVHGVLPRSSRFSRKAAGTEAREQVLAANLDVVAICTSPGRDLNPRRIERYLALAWESGARPVVLLTKADTVDDAAPSVRRLEAVAAGVQVLATSGVTGEGTDALRELLAPGTTVALLGSSGVGKSTLINCLAGERLQRVAEVRQKDEKGRHTTTHREIVRLPGGALVVDTPGIRELQLWDADAGLGATFADVEELTAGCRFNDCRHDTEPGCALREAVEAGELAADRLASYLKLQRELEHLGRKQDVQARLTEKRRWKTIHRAVRDLPKR